MGLQARWVRSVVPLSVFKSAGCDDPIACLMCLCGPYEGTGRREETLMRLRGLIFLLALPSLACESSLSPDAVAGTYVLRRVGGDLLPAVLYTTEYSRVRVWADTLVFRADGQGTRSSLLE